MSPYSYRCNPGGENGYKCQLDSGLFFNFTAASNLDMWIKNISGIPTSMISSFYHSFKTEEWQNFTKYVINNFYNFTL